jgi:F-type H+-transporting ATPase subunit delta
MAIESVARRYTRALFEVSRERGDEDAVLVALQELQQLWRSLPELRHALGNPQIPSEKRVAVLRRVVGADAPESIQQFVQVIVRHARVEVLRHAGDLMRELVDEARGVRHATVTVALALTAEQERNLRDTLREMLACEMVLDTRVDPSLIGGVSVRIGDLVVDGSIQQRLGSIRRHFERERELRARAVEG